MTRNYKYTNMGCLRTSIYYPPCIANDKGDTMDRLDLMFYADDFQCAISTGKSVREDQEQEKMDGGEGIIVSHVTFESENVSDETALDVIMGSHYLQEDALPPANGSSTLENLLTAVFAAGVKYARGESQKLHISDM